MLALDWAKAFGNANIDSLMGALERYGFPPKDLRLLSNITYGRQFYAVDMGSNSSTRPQRSGISQGCTLSPLLFITIMTALM